MDGALFLGCHGWIPSRLTFVGEPVKEGLKPLSRTAYEVAEVTLAV